MTLNGATILRCNAPCRPRLALLDPRTGAFSPTHEQPSSMDVDSMSLLADAHVLLIGGSMRNDAAPSATIYDPVADQFTPVGAPLRHRSWPFVVTLADGRVLVGGGEADGTATAELFDPATGTFSPAGDMARPRGSGASGTRLADGRVLVVGGDLEAATSAELFDPATGTFAPTGAMTVGRIGGHSATLLADGRVLVAGGLVPDRTDPRAPFTMLPNATPSMILNSTAAAEISTPRPGRSRSSGRCGRRGTCTPRRSSLTGRCWSPAAVTTFGGAIRCPSPMRRFSTRRRVRFGPRAASCGPGSGRPRSPSTIGCSCSASCPNGIKSDTGGTTEWFR